MQCGRTGQSKMRRHNWGVRRCCRRRTRAGLGANGRIRGLVLCRVPRGPPPKARAYPVAAIIPRFAKRAPTGNCMRRSRTFRPERRPYIAEGPHVRDNRAPCSSAAIFGQRLPLAFGPEYVENPAQHFAHVDLTFASTVSPRRDHRRNNNPFVVSQISWSTADPCGPVIPLDNAGPCGPVIPTELAPPIVRSPL